MKAGSLSWRRAESNVRGGTIADLQGEEHVTICGLEIAQLY